MLPSFLKTMNMSGVRRRLTPAKPKPHLTALRNESLLAYLSNRSFERVPYPI